MNIIENTGNKGNKKNYLGFFAAFVFVKIFGFAAIALTAFYFGILLKFQKRLQLRKIHIGMLCTLFLHASWLSIIVIASKSPTPQLHFEIIWMYIAAILLTFFSRSLTLLIVSLLLEIIGIYNQIKIAENSTATETLANNLHIGLKLLFIALAINIAFAEVKKRHLEKGSLTNILSKFRSLNYWQSSLIGVGILLLGFNSFLILKKTQNREPDSTSDSNAVAATPSPPPTNIRDIAKRTLAGTLLVTVYDKNEKPFAIGSGFFVSSRMAVTNFHVVKGAKYITVTPVESSSLNWLATSVAEDAKNDIAILSVTKDESPNLALPIGDPGTLEIGDKIYAAGNPEGMQGTFTDGLISKVHQLPNGYRFQMSVPVSSGSSGGPVLNADGEVVAVTVAKINGGENLNIAIPFPYVLKLLLKRLDPNVLVESSELQTNESLLKQFGTVCDLYANIDLPKEYFRRFTQTETNAKNVREIIDAVQPSTKAIYALKGTDNVLLLGAHKLDLNLSKGKNSDAIKELFYDFDAKIKQMHKNSSILASSYRHEVIKEGKLQAYLHRVQFKNSEGKITDQVRKYYFIPPFCRLDFYYEFYEKNDELTKRIIFRFEDALKSSLGIK